MTGKLERKPVPDIFLGNDKAHSLPKEQPDTNTDRHREDVHPNDHPVPIRRDTTIVRQPALQQRVSSRTALGTHKSTLR